MLLSLCIPTYNRAVQLNELLESLSLDPEAKSVEICISDNASTDNIALVVDTWRSKGFHILFQRNEKNFGADFNYLAVSNMASGDYIWLFGSDDKFENGAISAIKEFINYFPDRGVYLFSRTEYVLDFSEYLGIRNWIDVGEKDPVTFDFFDKSQRVCFFQSVLYLGGLFSYLSSILVHRDSWQKAFFDDRLMGTAYSHVFKLFQVLLNSSHSLLTVSKYSPVKTRLGDDSFRSSAGQRLMLDIDGYKLISETSILAKERVFFYTPFRRFYYLDYLSGVLNQDPSFFSFSKWKKIWAVCGYKSILRNLNSLFRSCGYAIKTYFRFEVL